MKKSIENPKITHKYTSEQKLAWFGYGEWTEEPDSITFEYRKIKCMVSRTVQERYDPVYGGHLCGYILVPKNHPWESKPHRGIDCKIHGGLSFSGAGDEGLLIGFDCNHYNDLTPTVPLPKTLSIVKDICDLGEAIENLPANYKPKTYKNIDFCIGECCSLVGQMLAVTNLLPISTKLVVTEDLTECQSSD